MTEVPILQHMYAKKGQFIAERQAENLPNEPPKQYFMYFVVPMLVGVFFSGVPLSIVMTLYLRNQCK